MPAPIENTKRMEIIRRHQAGESLRSISTAMSLSYETVKHLWQHWCREGRIEPNYARAKQRGTRHYEAVYSAAIGLKRAHPRWGAGLIRLQLEQAQADSRLPSVRTFQRWFRDAGLQRPARQRQARDKRVQRGKEPHAVWAVDAKEQIRLADGSWASWLLVSDEASGAVLATAVFSPPLLDSSGSQRGAGEPATGLRAVGATPSDAL